LQSINGEEIKRFNRFTNDAADKLSVGNSAGKLLLHVTGQATAKPGLPMDLRVLGAWRRIYVVPDRRAAVDDLDEHWSTKFGQVSNHADTCRPGWRLMAGAARHVREVEIGWG